MCPITLQTKTAIKLYASVGTISKHNCVGKHDGRKSLICIHVAKLVALLYVVMLRHARQKNHRYHRTCIFSYAALITFQNGLHPTVCKIPLLSTEFVSFLIVLSFFLVRSADSMIRCSRSVSHRILKLKCS
jgi:hypothetical protein